MSETVELAARDARAGGTTLRLVTKYTAEVVEATRESLLPLLDRAALDHKIFVAAVVTEFSAAALRASPDVRAWIEENPRSFIAQIAHQAASLGLCPGVGPTGKMASVVFRKVSGKDAGGKWQTTGVLTAVQPEWRGVIHLIKRANPAIVDIKVALVGDEDIFETDELNDTILVHRTPSGKDPCEPKVVLFTTGFQLNDFFAGYAVVTFTDGRRRYIRITRADVVRSIAASETMKLKSYEKEKGQDSRTQSPWVLHTKPMVYKTVAHALYRKPDVWSAAAGMNFAALEHLAEADKAINILDKNRIVPPGIRDARVDTLLETAAMFGGNDETLTIAAKSLGYDDPALAVNAGKLSALVDRVRDALRA